MPNDDAKVLKRRDLTPEYRKKLEELDLVAEWLDRRYLDPLLGAVFPGAGDTVCSLIGLYGIYVAWQLRVHPAIIARMLLNLALDALIGSVPLLGWIGDFFFRAHVRNLELLEERAARGEPTAGDWLWVIAAALAFGLAVLGPLLLLVAAGYWLLNWL